MSSDELMMNNTMAGNSAAKGGAVFCSSLSSPTIENCILWNNTASTGTEVYLEHSLYTSSLEISFSDLEGGQSSVHVDPECTLDWGAGMIDEDPLFVAGLGGEYYLANTATGHAQDSPCLDSGDPAGDMIWGTTRIDHLPDSGVVDMGHHYPLNTISTALTCTPSSGTVPFVTSIGVEVTNEFTGFARRCRAHIDASLANGTQLLNFKGPATLTLNPGATFNYNFNQIIPAAARVIGTNTFTLIADDVTPPPFNQPPYPLSGDTDNSACTVTGIAP